jgi:hypothetical protein
MELIEHQTKTTQSNYTFTVRAQQEQEN